MYGEGGGRVGHVCVCVCVRGGEGFFNALSKKPNFKLLSSAA